MAIQAINHYNAIASFRSFGANPVQQLGMLVIIMLAINAITNIPVARAETQNFSQLVCEKLCEPLPGGKDDPPERVCEETCMKGVNVVSKVTTKEKLEGGAWKVIGSGMSIFDCSYICSPEFAAKRAAANAAWAGVKWATGDKEGATKDVAVTGYGAVCSSLLIGDYLKPGVGTAACWVCCTPMKYFGKA